MASVQTGSLQCTQLPATGMLQPTSRESWANPGGKLWRESGVPLNASTLDLYLLFPRPLMYKLQWQKSSKSIDFSNSQVPKIGVNQFRMPRLAACEPALAKEWGWLMRYWGGLALGQVCCHESLNRIYSGHVCTHTLTLQAKGRMERRGKSICLVG